MNVKNNFRNRYSLIRHILHATARNSCFEDDCFLLLCWRDQQASRITLRLIFGYLDFAPATEQLVQPLLWFQGLAPQSLGWQTCQKPPGLFHLCQKHLTEVTAHVRAQLGPVNHYQNDQKKKITFSGKRAEGRDEPAHSDSVDSATQFHSHSSQPSCLRYLESTMVSLDAFGDAF